MIRFLATVLLPLAAAISTDDLMPLGGLPSMQTNMNVPNLNTMGNMNAMSMPAASSYVGNMPMQEERVPCSCGIFLNGQFRRGSNEPPRGNAALLQELTEPFQCNALGEKQCTNKCLETIMRHLPNSPVMVCGSIDRDCHKERAYLFVKNCKDRWINTNLSAGKEYCCKDGVPYKCPPS